MTRPEIRPGAIARPVLAGHQAIAALWLPNEWYDEAARRRVVLQWWSPGSALLAFDDGDLLRWPAPRVGDCEALPGWPLRLQAGRLCSAEIDAAQLADAGPADVLLAVGAHWRALRLVDATSLDPATWLDESVGFVDMADCRLPPAERVLVAPAARELREVLGPDVPGEVTSETMSFLKALAKRRESASAKAARPAPPSFGKARGGGLHDAWNSSAGNGAARLASVFCAVVLVGYVVSRLLADPASGSGSAPVDGNGSGGGIPPGVFAAIGFLVFQFLRSRAYGDGGGNGQGGGTAQGRTPAPAAARGPREGLLARARRVLRALPARASGRVMPQRWREWAARLARTSGIADLLGAQHAAYLRRMMKMFDDGDLDAALRHAIPLGGDADSLGQSFGLLKARDQLSLRNGGASVGIGLGDDLEAHLRQLYRHTFKQLDAKGRIDEAVFVLAELLKSRQEALDYLEKHERFKQAAELALGWDMPAAQIVRLHALAGDWRTALLVARRDNAFDAAVALLEKRWPDAAAQLRREWADTLVARGQWLAAVRVVWQLEAERERAGEWLEVAEGADGAMAARALALRAHCLPDTLAAHEPRVAALLDDPQAIAERSALGHELLDLPTPTSPAARQLATLLAGAAIADLAGVGPPQSLTQAQVKRLVELAGDAALSADLPASAWPGRVPTPLAAASGTLGWFAPEAGAHDIVDALALADGEFLVALGEAGAVRVDARGRWRARFPVPVHQLVISTDGHVALGLARRERTWRVSRLDLVRGQVEDLGMHEFHAFANTFDGIGWSVASGRAVQVLDTTRGLREAQWQVADLPGPVVMIDARGDAERWLIEGPDGHELWHYALPARRLMGRDPLPAPSSDQVVRVMAGGVGPLEFAPRDPDDTVARVHPLLGRAQPWKDVPWHGAQAILAVGGTWLVLREPVDEAAAEQAIALVNLATGRVHGRCFWPRGAQVRVRDDDGTWMLFDDQGRVCAIATQTSDTRSVSVR